jgi:hypothetical protein
VNSHSPVGLVSRQWDAVDWACVLCDRRIHNDRASRSASSRQCACPSYSSRAGFLGKASHHPGLSAPLQPRFGFLRLLAFSKHKIAVEREEICKCDGHTIHKLSQRHITVDWLVPRENDWSRMYSKVSSDWLPSDIHSTRPVLEIFKMAGYIPDSPRNVAIVRRRLFGRHFICVTYWSKQHVTPEICAFLGRYTAYGDNFSPKFRDIVSVPSTKVKKSLDSLILHRGGSEIIYQLFCFKRVKWCVIKWRFFLL